MTELAFNVLPYRVTHIRTTVTDEEKKRGKEQQQQKRRVVVGGGGGWASGRWGGGGGLTEDLASATLTCRLCVRVIINKLYFEPFMCLVFSDSLSSNIPNILPAGRPLPLQVWTQEPDS